MYIFPIETKTLTIWVMDALCIIFRNQNTNFTFCSSFRRQNSAVIPFDFVRELLKCFKIEHFFFCFRFNTPNGIYVGFISSVEFFLSPLLFTFNSMLGIIIVVSLFPFMDFYSSSHNLIYSMCAIRENILYYFIFNTMTFSLFAH